MPERDLKDQIRDQLYTFTEAADRLGVVRQTVARWVDKGILEGVTIGARTYIRRTAVASILGRAGRRVVESNES